MRDVLVAEVGEEHLGLDPLPRQPDLVLDLPALHGLRERRLVVVDRGAGDAHGDALDRQRRPAAAPCRAARRRRLHDPPPVGVGAVQRRLHERRVGDGARDRLDARLMPAAHDHAPDPLGALAVGDHHDRELAQERVERLAEQQLVLALGRDLHPARARADQDRRVVGRELAVDRGAVERALDAHAEQQVGRLRPERGVGLHEAQHRREVRRDHPGALALGAEAHGARWQLDLEVGALLGGVGRLDRLLEGHVSALLERGTRGEDALQHLLDGQVVADPAGRGERDLGRVAAERHRRRALRLGGVVEPAPAGRRVGAAGVGEHRAQRRRGGSAPG